MNLYTRDDFDNLILKIKNDTFREQSINFFCLPRYWLTDQDLIYFAEAFNNNPWCVDNVEVVNISNQNFGISPQLKSTRLVRLSMFQNRVSMLPDLSLTPSLTELDIHSMYLSRIAPLRVCPGLKTLRACGNNLRVPPNAIGCQNLSSFFVIEGNQYTWLSKYALLVMGLYAPNLRLDYFNGRDLKKKFATHMKHKGNIEDLIRNFVIPQDFLSEQVAAVCTYMWLTYYNPIYPKTHPKQYVYRSICTYEPTPPKNLEQGERCIITKRQDGMFDRVTIYPITMSSILLDLRAEYRQAKFELMTLIDATIQKKFCIAIDIVINHIAPYLFDAKKHQGYFLDELNYDFNALREIFVDTENQRHVQVIDDFVTKNSASWPEKFDIAKKFNKDLGIYFDYVSQKDTIKFKECLEPKNAIQVQNVTNCEPEPAAISASSVNGLRRKYFTCLTFGFS